MKIALTGFFNSGKTTIFNALTRQKIETSLYPTPAEIIHKGVFHVNDPRLKKISEIVSPRKITPVNVECIDLAGLIKNNPVHNSKIFKEIMNADALVYVLRGFEDLSVPYAFETIDPVRDLNEIDYELLINDLELVTKRIEKMTEQKNKGQKINEREMEVLEFLRLCLEDGRVLRNVNLTEENLKEIKHLNFLSLKPCFSIINVDENSFKEGKFKDISLTVCGLLEMEISELPEEETLSFASAMGIDEPVIRKITEKIYQSLDCISFFTIVSEELRAWSIKKGTKALQAAGKIHSDIQRGFIKAEVISYNDFINVGGDISLAKKEGILRVEGKDYEVKDGEIITFRFKV